MIAHIHSQEAMCNALKPQPPTLSTIRPYSMLSPVYHITPIPPCPMQAFHLSACSGLTNQNIFHSILPTLVWSPSSLFPPLLTHMYIPFVNLSHILHSFIYTYKDIVILVDFQWAVLTYTDENQLLLQRSFYVIPESLVNKDLILFITGIISF